MSVEPKYKIIQRFDEEEDKLASLAHSGSADFAELCDAARSGDLERVEKAVAFGVNVNQIDEFDYSPLILASLCGHYEVVEYLLNNGAKCDRDTFQGERCLYGALTDSIRQLLLKFDISKAVDATQPFLAHLAKVFSRRLFSDVTFRGVSESGETTEVSAHRFFLASQSVYLKDVVTSKTKSVIPIVANMDDFEYCIRYLYFVESDARESAISHKLEVTFDDFYSVAVKTKLAVYFDQMLEQKLTTFEPEEDVIDALSRLDSFPDAAIYTRDEDTGSRTYYPVHKMLLARVEYFSLMFGADSFQGLDAMYSEATSSFPLLELDQTSAEVAEIFLQWLYTDKCEIPRDLALDVLFLADSLFADKLKSLAAIVISQAEKPVASMADILRAAWATRIERLEHYVAQHISNHLDEWIDKEEFLELVEESAGRVTARQETDTIELVDDVRYYLGKKWGVFEEDQDEETGRVDEEFRISQYERRYNEDLDRIDEMLEKLELGA
ncbi:BTB/POZ domain-containing protein 3 [Yarrowia sp. C11]|nr:BTB/POZ domain-containing protein 3 [Yarrowia sp. E02]KAG5369426.1 BTB/POZ domain-containing protein 3 [Yarrowia sp. C11]